VEAFPKRCFRCAITFEVKAEMVRGEADLILQPSAAKATTLTAGETSADFGIEEQPEQETIGQEPDAPLSETVQLPEEEAPAAKPPRKEKKKSKRKWQDDSDSSDKEESETRRFRSEEEEPENRKSRKLIIAGVVLGVVALAAGGGYYFFGQDPEPKKKAAAAPSGSSAADPDAVPPPSQNLATKPAEAEKKAVPPVKLPSPPSAAKVAAAGKSGKPFLDDESPGDDRREGVDQGPAAKPGAGGVIRRAAIRLALELAANADETKARYKGKPLEVSGLFDRIEKKQPYRGFFAVDGPVLGCDLDDSPREELRRWAQLRAREPITVRGTLGADALLHGCVLSPLSSPAEDRFKDKDIELMGTVGVVRKPLEVREFPVLQFELETNGLVEIECLFPKDAEAVLAKIKPGMRVTVAGKCSGRFRAKDDRLYIRVDNCSLVDTTAPPPNTPRLDVTSLLREYEEDLRTVLLPPPGTQPTLPPIPLAKLANEWAQNNKTLPKAYANQIIAVSGKLSVRDQNGALILESGQTDQPLKVRCLFSRKNFQLLDEGPNFTIRGLCSGMMDNTTLRLDNCEPNEIKKRKDDQRLNADYFPFVAGSSLSYDVATQPAEGKGPARLDRVTATMSTDHLIIRVTTHRGTLAAGKSIFDADHTNSWLTEKGTKKLTKSSPPLRYRLSAQFVEVGHQARSGETELIWEPVLKLGAKPGESWKWTDQTIEHVFTFEKLSTLRGKPCAIIKEIARDSLGAGRYAEIRHVYVRGVGEAEQQYSVRMASGKMKLVAESKLIDEEEPSPAGDSAIGGKAASAPPASPSGKKSQ
jgi:hypothetical protein